MFHLRVGDAALTYVADSDATRDAWIDAFHALVARHVDVHKHRYTA